MSMLRSSKFVKNFVSFARSIAIGPPKAIDRTLLERSNALTLPSYRTLARSTGSALSNNSSALDVSIQRLDQDVRRTGRVSAKELLEVFDEIRLSRQATSSQSLMIIRCCGNLVPEESPEVRTRLVNEIWETFEKMGVAMDISHYNALLRVYLENEHHFSPLEFLSTLDKKGVEPNRVTYQRLIAAYCQRGDIDGATQILEFMKDKQIPVNEAIFNSLITGHSQADDMESAVGILSVMKQANLQPSEETYSSLLCGYARKGDIEAIQRVMDECKSKDIDLSDRHILEIVFTLAVNNQHQHLAKVFSYLKKLPGFNLAAKNVILRLVAKNQDRAAVEVLKTMPSPANPEGEVQPIGNFLIKQLVKAKRPLDFIINLCEDLRKSGQNERALHMAVETSLNQNTPEMSLKLLSALAKFEAMCHHYYWPVLVQYGKKNDRKGVQATLKQIGEEMDQPISGETLKDYVVPYFQDPEAEIQELRGCGIPLATTSTATVTHLLSKNEIERAAQIALQYRANYNNGSLRRNLVSAFATTKDVESFVTIAQIIVEGSKEEDNDPAGKLLIDLCSYLKKDRAILIGEILQRYLDRGLGIESESANTIQEKLGEDLNPDVSNLLAKLTSPDLTPILLSRPPLVRYSNETTDKALIRSMENAQSRGESISPLKRKLFMYYCHEKQLENALKVKQELEEEGFDFDLPMLALLMDLYVHEGKLAEALDYFEKIKQKNSVPDDSKIIKLATLICSEQGPAEVINFIKNNPLSTSETKQNFPTVNLCWRLLNNLAEKKDTDNLKAVFEALVENKYVEPQNVVLGPLIKVHLLRDDVDAAMKQFEECCLKYRATPWKKEIARRLIETENAAALQRLTDLSTEVHGEINSLYDLVLCFIECGRVRQARRILETPGMKSRTQKLASACEKYDNEGSVNYLERLVEVTKDLYHIDRSDIYYHLLSSYCKKDDVEKALGLWTQMQDEDVQPSDQFLAKLGALLQQHERPVPFQIPKVLPETPKTDEPKNGSDLYSVRLFRKYLNAHDLDKALEIKDKIPESVMSMFDRSRLATQLYSIGRINEATRLLIQWLEKSSRITTTSLNLAVNSLAKLGDVDNLTTIGKYLSLDMKKKVSFSNRWTHCMVEAGRAPEVLDSLKKRISEANTPTDVAQAVDEFPKGGLFSVLNARPDLLEEAEQVAEMFRAKGALEPTNVLWIHYNLVGDTDKAEKAWEYLKNCNRILFGPVLDSARKSRDVASLERLLGTLQTTGQNARSLGSIHGAIIEIFVLNGEEGDALKRLHEALKTCTLDDIPLRILLFLKKTVEESGKSFPYKIEKKQRKNARNDDSSSSSDSDSDGKEAKKLETV